MYTGNAESEKHNREQKKWPMHKVAGTTPYWSYYTLARKRIKEPAKNAPLYKIINYTIVWIYDNAGKPR